MAQQDPLTYRSPRTLEEAFGPGQRGPLNEDGVPFFDAQDRPVMVTVAVIGLALLAAIFLGWRP